MTHDTAAFSTDDAATFGEAIRLFRSMEQAADGPVADANARALGARPGIDIPVTTNGMVRPGLGGMSVSPDSPMNLPRHRRPPEWSGTGKDPVWAISSDALGSALEYYPDPDDSSHGFIEPARPMTFNEYQEQLRATRSAWRLVRPVASTQ